MRPWNETAEDRRNEFDVMQRVCRHRFDEGVVRFEKLPVSYGLDYVLIDNHGRIVSFAEVKCRHRYRSTDFSHAIMSVLKVVSASNLTVCGIPVEFFWSWADCITHTRDIVPEFIAMAGRTDRGQIGDVEPCGHFMIAKMDQIWPKLLET